MNIDSFLKIGHSHTICQDYIFSGEFSLNSGIDVPYIILADGCSSAANSDIGARLLCYGALSILKQIPNLDKLDWHEFGYEVISNARKVLIDYFPTLHIDCLDATLIVAYRYGDYYKIFMYGDGCIYFINTDGSQHYRKVSFEPNAPPYLRYLINDTELYCRSNVRMSIERNDVDSADHFFDATASFQLDLLVRDIKTLVIASDGIESFMFKDEELYKTRYLNLRNAVRQFKIRPSVTDLVCDDDDLVPVDKEISFLKVFQEITDFKLTKGPFLNRRVKKVLKEYLKSGFTNDDDLSIGCFNEDS